MFKIQILDPDTIADITEEITDLGFLEAAVAEAMDWTCQGDPDWWYEEIQTFSTQVKAQLTMMKTMSEHDVLDIQDEIEAGDTSWQTYHTFHESFEDLKNQYSAKCGVVPTPQPTDFATV